MADEWAIALQEAKRQAPEIWIQERGFREGWDALARRIVVSDDRSVVCWQGVNYIAQPLVESAREERVTLEQHGRVIEAMADMEQRAHAAEAEVEHLRTGLRERGFIVGRNPDGVDDTVASALLIVDDFKAANGRLREALTAVAGYKHAPLIESLDDARRVAAAALSPREDALSEGTHIDLIATEPLSADGPRLIRRTQPDDPDIGKQVREGWATYVAISEPHTMDECPFPVSPREDSERRASEDSL